MADTQCPIIVGTDPAVAQVFGIQGTILGFANQAYQLTTQQVQLLNNFDVDPYNFNVTFNVNEELTSYVRPAGVPDPDITYNPIFAFPVKPGIVWPGPITPGAEPTFDATPPVITIGAPPSLVVPPEPDAPVLTDVVIPPVPNYVLPVVPTMRAITLPTEPTITLPTFNAVAPVRDFDAPSFNFDFSPEQYVSDLLDRVRARITTMLQGGTGLPAAIEQALFDRAVEREDRTSLAALQAVDEDISCRGFDNPDSGIRDRRRAAVRQANREARLNLNRDNLINMRQIEVENLRFAVTQGIALETVLQDLFFKQQGLLLDSLKFRAELQQRVLDARIAIANLDATLYQAQAQVFRDLIQAELAKLEIYRGQLEARRLIGTLNQQDIDLYLAQLKGIDTLVEIFKSQVEGQNAISANNNAKVQAFVGLNQARAETIRALGFEFDAYKTQTEAEGVKANIFDTLGRVFLSRTQAYDTIERNKLERGRFSIEVGKALLDQWSRESQNVVEKLRADALTVTTKLDVFKGLLDRMRIYADIEQVANSANARNFELALREAELLVQTQLKSVDLSIDQNEKVKSIILEAMRTAATVGAQLTGSALSALNASASMSHSSSTSSGCSTSFNYSQDLTQNN